MKLNENEIKLFQALAKSQLGQDLAAYLDRLGDYICDSRSWGDGDTKESANRAAKVIKENLRSRILMQKEIIKVKETFE